jgi:hypothetical protein
MRSRASDIFPNTYWVATYPTPITPAPIARGVLYRRSHFLEAEIMTWLFVAAVSCRNVKSQLLIHNDVDGIVVDYLLA